MKYLSWTPATGLRLLGPQLAKEVKDQPLSTLLLTQRMRTTIQGRSVFSDRFTSQESRANPSDTKARAMASAPCFSSQDGKSFFSDHAPRIAGEPANRRGKLKENEILDWPVRVSSRACFANHHGICVATPFSRGFDVKHPSPIFPTTSRLRRKRWRPKTFSRICPK